MMGGHRERERRLTATCPVELRHGEVVIAGTTEDIGRHGLYVRTTEQLPVGSPVVARITLPDRTALDLALRVIHVLQPPAAQALGRFPGIGLFIEGVLPAAWSAFLDALEQEAAAHPEERPLAVVVLDRSAPLRERIETNLAAGGFECRLAGDVASAVDLCRRATPDILLADGRSQGSNPLLVLRLLSGDPDLAGISVVIMSEDAGDLVRLQAFRRGARDFIPKPFTDEELMIRLRRVGPRAGRPTRHVALRGVIEDVGVPTVLSLLEFEKRPGVLVLARESQVGRLFVSDGRVRRAELAGCAHPQQALDTLLQWKHGSFAFLPGRVTCPDEIGQTISSLLVDHARVHDEAERPPRPHPDAAGPS